MPLMKESDLKMLNMIPRADFVFNILSSSFSSMMFCMIYAAIPVETFRGSSSTG